MNVRNNRHISVDAVRVQRDLAFTQRHVGRHLTSETSGYLRYFTLSYQHISRLAEAPTDEKLGVRVGKLGSRAAHGWWPRLRDHPGVSATQLSS